MSLEVGDRVVVDVRIPGELRSRGEVEGTIVSKEYVPGEGTKVDIKLEDWGGSPNSTPATYFITSIRRKVR